MSHNIHNRYTKLLTFFGSHFDSDKFRLLLLNMVVYANRLTKTKAPLGDLERATVVPLEKRRLGGSQTGAASAPRCTTSCNFTF